MQAALLSSDPYARRLAQWFTKLDGLDALKRPGKPPDQDQQVQDERLKALRALLAFARNQTPLVRFALASSVCSAREHLRPALGISRRHRRRCSSSCDTAPPLSFPLLATRLLLSPLIEQRRPHCSITASPTSRCHKRWLQNIVQNAEGSSPPSRPLNPVNPVTCPVNLVNAENVLCDV